MSGDPRPSGSAHPDEDQSFLDDVATAAVDALAAGAPLDLDRFLAARPELESVIRSTASTANAAFSRSHADVPVLPGTELVRLLGRGATGDVHLARDHAHDDRLVAVKLLRDPWGASPGMRERFVDEAAALARLAHPHVVAIHDTFEVGDAFGYVMEWVDGRSLAEAHREVQIAAEVDSAEPTFAPVVRIGSAIARALGAVHRAGLVHRDVKPSNILIARDGTPKLSDFGLVRDADDPHGTKTGWFVGTAPYAAPEQLRGDHRAVDARTDVYGLGAVLYECLTGTPPFGIASPVETLRRVERIGLRAPRRIDPRIPRDLETIVCRALEPEPRLRYASADALADDLDRALRGEPVWARRPSVRQRCMRFARRRPLTAALLGAGLLVGIGSGAVAAYTLPRLEVAWTVEREAATQRQTIRAWQELGEGHLRDAQLRFADLLAADATDAAALAGIVLAHARARQFDEAERRIAQHAVPGIDDATAQRLRAFVLQARGKTADAAALRTATLAPSTPIELLLDAQLAMAPGIAGDAAAALQSVTESIARATTQSLLAHLVRCEAATRTGDVALRDRCIDTLFRLWPDSAEARAGVGMILRRAKDLPAAERHLRDAIRLAPDFATAMNALGNTLQDLDRYAEAVGMYRAALAVRSDYADALYNLGNALLHLEAWDEAIEQFERAEALDPNLRFARLNLATALMGAGRHRDAIAQLLVYGGADPSPRTLVNLADCYIRLGDAARATDAIGRAMALEAGDPQFATYIGHALARLGRYEEAMPFLQVAKQRALQRPKGDQSPVQWLDCCERLRGVAAQLADPGTGPAAGAALLDTAAAASRFGRHVTAATLDRAAFVADPALLDRARPPHILGAAANAACASQSDVLDGNGQTLAQRAAWAHTAIDWLEIQAALLARDEPATLASERDRWAVHPAFAGVHDEARLAELPPDAQQRCRSFWVR